MGNAEHHLSTVVSIFGKLTSAILLDADAEIEGGAKC
jgi:hypothetical protein